MHAKRILAIIFIGLIAKISFTQSSTATNQIPELSNDGIILKIKNDSKQYRKNFIAELNSSLNLQNEKIIDIKPVHIPENHRTMTAPSFYQVKAENGTDLDQLLTQLGQLPFVEYAEINYRYDIAGQPNDPLFPWQWSLFQKNSIQALHAWDEEKGDPTVIIGLLDTGVDITHPDLAPNVWKNNDEIPDNGLDDDANGYIDDVYGWDFSDDDNDPSAESMKSSDVEYGWHGTHCAGILVAVPDNQQGCAGVAGECMIMPVKIFPYAYLGRIVNAIYYAVDNGAQILNFSWGGYFMSKSVQEAIEWAESQGVLCVGAAGNNRKEQKFYPAAYPEVFSVAAIDSNGFKSGFSNFGDWIDISAPGEDILSTMPVNYGDFEPYFYEDGTSMAAPLVAGTAALLKSRFPDWSPRQIREQIKSTAEFLPNSEKIGAGCVNSYYSIVCPPESTLSIYTDTTLSAKLHEPFETQFKAYSGAPPYTWKLKNQQDLPAGLNFDETGRLWGNPEEYAQLELNITVYDQNNDSISAIIPLDFERPDFITIEDRNKNNRMALKTPELACYPNPVSAKESNNQTIHFWLQLPSDSNIELNIYNLLGRKVTTLGRQYLSAGEHEITWNWQQSGLNHLASGIYFYELRTSNFRIARRFLVLD